jgi:tetratricopeptide (TPR) repeat protein
VSPRARMVAVVAALAALAAVVVAGGTVLSADDVASSPTETQRARPQPGAPPLLLELGVRDDREAEALRRAESLYAAGRRSQARVIFAADDSLEGKLGAAFSGWPGTLDRVEQLGALYPRSSLVQLHVGIARYWAGERGALDAWREARDVEPDTPYAVRATDLLHPEFAPGLPPFTAGDPLPPDVKGAPAAQFELLRKKASSSSVSVTYALHYGIALQRLGRPVSAKRVFTAAARAHPRDVDALVADAVGRYSKEQPEDAFGRLGPLTRRFPRAATVRFHLGVLLLWQRDLEAGRKQLRLAESEQPGSRLARDARRYLDELAKAGTG